MSDRMTPIPFGNLMNWILKEHKKGAIFGVRRPFVADPSHTYEIFGRKLETPFGPAAGPHTQLAQNIVASYVAGSRFFELKTVQKLDGEDLPVNKPCIKADDECYNCEWSTELYVPQAFDEYVKAWFACQVVAKEYGLGAMDGFQFNMSVGYDLEGIKLEKIDKFIEGMKDASETPVFKECRQWLLDNADLFEKVTKEDIEGISPEVCNCATLSTLHGCPPQEIERIARYLIEEKKVHTFIKCNPTLLGYEYARDMMDSMGYDYVAFGDFHFKDDLQYSDAVPMLERLQALAGEKGLEFGVKITNTFPVDVKAGELPSEEMYMSGKSLYPLSMSVAMKLARDFGGKLRISYSGGADYFNIKDIVDAGIWPVTMATTMLKPGGYQRLEQIGQIFAKDEAKAFEGVNAERVAQLVEAAKTDKHHVKAVKPLPSRKIKRPVPLTDCFVAPCEEGCPIHQDITTYLKLMGAGKAEEALEVILLKNPLPFITGTICAHNCMSKCTRNFYETPVNIRRTKLEAAEGGFETVMAKLKKPEITSGKTAAVVGGGPAGMAAAYFLARGGVKTTLFEKEEKLGGVVRNVIPGFRISDGAIDNDAKLIEAMGVEIVTGREIGSVDEVKKDYDYVVLALGASTPGVLRLEKGQAMNALEFLAQFKATDGNLDLGENVVVIGGGNTAMDTARAAKRNKGVKKVSLVYRRTKRYMPADAEELEMAIEDGVEFAELLSPVKLENGVLYCKKMVLGDYDASGRRGVVETDEVVEVPADTVIAAVGEKVPGAFYEANGIALDNRGRVQADQETLETSVAGVYAAGDGLYGPATVVEGIRDGMKAAEAILGRAVAEDLFSLSDEEKIYGRKGNLMEEDGKDVDSKRCLSCNSYCENCVEVCPNRANITLTVPGMERHQIIHVDYMCNECGNCKSFCPWDSAPYLDKFTLFANEKDMEDSKNQGFVVLDRETGACKVRLQGKVTDYVAGTASDVVPEGIAKIIGTVIRDYAYML
ncbi:putative selenate reductase subunit YgfK [Enterocloster asparagiformis]|uniref:Putative selenate reductase, YgfK subunit n=2 Tax=Enterocloster asparagiformis TaxID=333367 RepID=C0D1U0_9FIRM|nr:putative selenate reductase subunit YgfK [Enterocloster asparagiformis]EEG54702.1 putative selenate reductase, YgfK subunit [[Clostridium] asparagiforme DSM 15981]RGX21656.1 putative selenate reductase subunit YgfK [Enterocloster asparagiformis]